MRGALNGIVNLTFFISYSSVKYTGAYGVPTDVPIKKGFMAYALTPMKKEYVDPLVKVRTGELLPLTKNLPFATVTTKE